MRMWMVNPEKMCSQHLRGEYLELFMFLGTLKRKKKITGYLNNNLIEPLSILERFFALKNEMLKRGYNAKKPFVMPEDLLDYLSEEQKNVRIDKSKALDALLSRCSQCKKLHEENSKDAQENSTEA